MTLADHVLVLQVLKLVGVAVAGLSLFLGGCGREPSGTGVPELEPAAPPQVVARGQYLVSVLGCHDCHTPFIMGKKGPEPDMSRMLSGHPQNLKVGNGPKLEAPWVWAGTGTNTAYSGPWGISYAANLTPHPVSGLKIWTEDMFVRAIRTGKHMGQSRPINPPMPWPVYRNLTDEDLTSVYWYLRTIPPVHNEVPTYEPPDEAR